MAQVQAVNQRALRCYTELVGAIDVMHTVIEDANKLITSMSEGGGVRAYGWRVPTKKEVIAARDKAMALLDGFRNSLKQYEKELISRTWRV